MGERVTAWVSWSPRGWLSHHHQHHPPTFLVKRCASAQKPCKKHHKYIIREEKKIYIYIYIYVVRDVYAGRTTESTSHQQAASARTRIALGYSTRTEVGRFVTWFRYIPGFGSKGIPDFGSCPTSQRKSPEKHGSWRAVVYTWFWLKRYTLFWQLPYII